jgi:hypothetical protein
MRIFLYIPILISLAITLNGQNAVGGFIAGTDFGVLVADSDASYSPGFTLTDNPTSIGAVGTDGPGNAISLWFNTAVDMSFLVTSGARLDFTTNSGHVANSSFSISLFDSTFGAEDVITGFNWGDTLLVGSMLSLSSINLTDIQNIVINTGGIGDAVNVDIAYFGLVPEPSTYALILGALVLGFVALRRR